MLTMKNRVNLCMVSIFVCCCIGCHSSKQLYNSLQKQTVYIGPTREFISLQDFINSSPDGRINNVHIIIDEGTFISENELWIQGENIIIEGRGKVNLFCKTLYENVMWIEGSNIHIKNLRMKHFKPGEPEGQNCSGRVIAFDHAENIVIEDCDLNGCGLTGLHNNGDNENILVRNNYIHNNSLGAFSDWDGEVWLNEIKDHPVFRFENNRIENNGPNRIFEPENADSGM